MEGALLVHCEEVYAGPLLVEDGHFFWVLNGAVGSGCAVGLWLSTVFPSAAHRRAPQIALLFKGVSVHGWEMTSCRGSIRRSVWSSIFSVLPKTIVVTQLGFTAFFMPRFLFHQVATSSARFSSRCPLTASFASAKLMILSELFSDCLKFEKLSL
jgi:hypothetical protein